MSILLTSILEACIVLTTVLVIIILARIATVTPKSVSLADELEEKNQIIEKQNKYIKQLEGQLYDSRVINEIYMRSKD